MIPNSTKSKRSTASATDTKNSRWFRFKTPETDLPELDQLLDLYWGGPERRITTLTTRIIGVNALALIMLLVGILFLGEYKSDLIEVKLERFNTETQLVAEALETMGIEDGTLSLEKSEQLINGFSEAIPHRVRLFNENGQLILDSQNNNIKPIIPYTPEKEEFYSIEVLKSLAKFVVDLFPGDRSLPLYPETSSVTAADYPDATEAMTGRISLSAWSNAEENVFLSAAVPLSADGKSLTGIVLLTRTARDINHDIAQMWLNIVGAFGITLIITVFLSIYLAGVIANPLRKLASAAEGVRKGKLSPDEIPNFSNRKDEIGELSLAFREMTSALLERMDSIDRFAADVAHELKNPLTSLRSATETVAIVKKAKDKEKLMNIIRHDIERLDRLITDISHASRLDSELSRDVFEQISVRFILNNMVNAYKSPLERKESDILSWENTAKVNDIKIETQCSTKDDLYVMGHAGRLEQVFQNILGNALSFSPKKGTVRINITAGNKRVRITFEDEGPGIPEKKISSIFDRFYSQRPDHEDYGKHSGLGLSICKQIITAMNGEIFAENIKDSDGKTIGARFVVVLTKI